MGLLSTNWWSTMTKLRTFMAENPEYDVEQLFELEYPEF